MFGPYRSHFLSRKSLIAAKNETKEKRWIGERDTQTVRVNEAQLHSLRLLRVTGRAGCVVFIRTQPPPPHSTLLMTKTR